MTQDYIRPRTPIWRQAEGKRVWSLPLKVYSWSRIMAGTGEPSNIGLPSRLTPKGANMNPIQLHHHHPLLSGIP
jgi:hypothetical protein